MVQSKGEPTAKAVTGRCLVCGKPALTELEGFAALPRVTSDCLPFRTGGVLLTCGVCGSIQKRPDATWLDEIREIYSRYYAYHQGGGTEQMVFDARAGRLRRRSEVLVDFVLSSGRVSGSGKVLDVGCGHGVTLSAFSAAMPNLRLFGTEYDARNVKDLSRIPGFVELFTGEIAAVQATFAAVTMIHSLEHFPDPLGTLTVLRAKLEPGGVLFVEVCNAAENPFDLVIADHLLHFTPASLEWLLEKAGLHTVSTRTDIVAKELSFISEPGAAMTESKPRSDDGDALAKRNVEWLTRVKADAERAANEKGGIGIFGSSIGATWLAAALGEKASYFVDEDPARRGRQHMGRPIISPDMVERGSAVYLALPPATARAIRCRLSAWPVDLLIPPEFG